MTLTVEYELTMEDPVALQLSCYEHTPYLRDSYRKGRYLGCPLLLIVIGLILTFAWKFVGAAIIFGLAALYWIHRYPTTVKKSAEKMVKGIYSGARDKGKLLCKHRIKITPEGVESKTDFKESKVRWNAVEQIVSTGDHIFIFVSPTVAEIIPKRAFSDETSYKEFIEIARKFHSAPV